MRSSLDDIFAREWGGALPDGRYSSILAEVDDGELVGFCVLEELIRCGNFFTAPSHRGGMVARRLIERVRSAAAQTGRSFVAFAHANRDERLFRMLGMRRVADATYRSDFFLFRG